MRIFITARILELVEILGMLVKITWYKIDENNYYLWQVNRGLYIYKSKYDEILYIGKVDGTTVRQRAQPSAKPNVWNRIYNERGNIEFNVFVGLIELPKGNRLSRQLLVDIESLLIYEIQPVGNNACTKSRISRPGLYVKNFGNWSHNRVFLDT